MADLIARRRGYAHGRIIEPGERFSWPDDKSAPSWAILARTADAVDLDEPAQPAPAADAVAAIRRRRQPRPPGSAETAAPAAVRVENEVNAATGGTQPDWIPPGG